MPIYHISCVNLQTTQEDQESIYQKIAEAMPNNHIEGIQRALIVLQYPFTEEIKDAYEVVAYFHSNQNSPGRMRFQRQNNLWSEKDVKSRLKRNKKLEQTLDVQEIGERHYSITFETSPKSEMPRRIKESEKEKEVIGLEEFFLRQGAFPRSVKRRTKIIEGNN